jgi:photosystem II stability/assembly factor-like uncharacterized protein
MSSTLAWSRALVLLTAAAVAADTSGEPAAKRAAASAKPDAKAKGEKASLDKLLAGLKFRSIGPYRGGRVTAVTGVRGRPLTFYFGGTGGGVFRTVDGGSSWEPISDKDLKTGSVGAIALAESDPNVLYVGMGEAPIRGNVSHGDGVYKSTDGGKSFRNVGLRDTSQISRIFVHPKDPDLVYVAAQGHVYGKSPERGIFRSEDGGKSWKKVLFVDDATGASDLAMDPSNPRILFAGFWQVVRRPWELVSGGPGSGLYRSTDGGDSWKKLSEGLPEGTLGKIGVTVSPARPERVWAMVEAKEGGLFRSDDGGEKWTRVNDENKLRQRAWYYSSVIADPSSAENVYVLNVQIHKSVDGGKTFTSIRAPHGDNHDLWIDPDQPDRMINGNDGGATITFNGGRTWSTLDNQPTAQIYRVATDDRFPYRVYGAQQDNSTIAIPSRVRGSDIETTDWYAVGGCESGWVAPKPKEPDVVFAGCYGGSITRYDHRTGEEREVIAWPQLAIGQAPKDLRYRFQWNAPILVSRDGKRLYHAAQMLLMSTDEGGTWEEISPDLTRDDESKQGYSGGPITYDNTGIEVYDTIFTVVESPHDPATLWAGTDDGLVHVTKDGGKTWKNVTPKSMPEWIQVNALEVSPHDGSTVYAAATMYKHDDFRPYLFRTTDEGKSWTKIVAGIPDGAFTRVVREDPVRRGLLYAGTETGFYVSFDAGERWQPLQRNLPAVPITDMVVKGEDLVVATQGRAFQVLDDLSPLRQWKDEVASADVHLFRPEPAVRMASEERDDEGPPTARRSGENRRAGAFVTYFLKEKPDENTKLTLEILDGDTVLRTFETKKKKKEGEEAEKKDDDDEEKPLTPAAGLNRFAWDLRMWKPTLVPKAVVWGSKKGPKVAPGTYTVRLTYGSRVLTEKLEVVPNPALGVSAEDLKSQAALLAKIRDRISETHEAVLQIRDVKAQAKAIRERAEKTGKGEGLAAKEKALAEKLTAVEEKLVNPKHKSSQDVLNFPPRLDHRYIGLASVVGSADAAPTRASLKLDDELEKQLAAVMAELKGVFDSELAGFNRAVRERDVAPVVLVTSSTKNRPAR